MIGFTRRACPSAAVAWSPSGSGSDGNNVGPDGDKSVVGRHAHRGNLDQAVVALRHVQSHRPRR